MLWLPGEEVKNIGIRRVGECGRDILQLLYKGWSLQMDPKQYPESRGSYISSCG